MNTQGEAITVVLGQMPGPIKRITVPGPVTTVEEILSTAEVSASGFEIRVDMNPANLHTEVRDGQTVLLVRSFKGNLL